MAVYQSIDHPEDRPAGFVLARALVGPLAMCTLPVMLGSLLALLEGVLVLPVALGGFGAALAVATIYARFRLARLPAEVVVHEDAAAVRSVWDVARGLPYQPQFVFDLRDQGAALFVTIGYESYTLPRRRWPQERDLARALYDARYGRPALQPG